MADFVFNPSTKVYFGSRQLPYLGEEVRRYGTKALLVYGGGSIKRNGIFDIVAQSLKEAGVSIVEFGGVESNPRITTVRRGADAGRREGVDVVLAVGGGSVIDCAKAIAIAIPCSGDVWDTISGKQPVGEVLPICTVLTMTGSGSETSYGTVITNWETKEKIGLASEKIIPAVSFLNPEFTYTVNAYQTACGSSDIMSHFFDFYYFSKQDNLVMQRRIMEAIMRTVVQYTPVAVRNPRDDEARANLMWAAAWGCSAIADSFAEDSMVCHFIEHELSAFYDITHGHGLAILMPRWMQYVVDNPAMAEMFQQFGVQVFDIDPALSVRDGAQAAIDAMSHWLFDELGLASSLTELGIDDSHFEQMAHEACKFTGGKLNAVVPLYPKDVVQILHACL